MRRELENLHGDSNHNVCCIPEGHITPITASGWRVPGHDNEVQIYSDIENNSHIPGAEGWAWEAKSLAPESDKIDADGEGDIEKGYWIDFQIDN